MMNLPKHGCKYYICVETDRSDQDEYTFGTFYTSYKEEITYEVDGKIIDAVSRVFPQPIFVCENRVRKGLNGSKIVYSSHVKDWYKLDE